MLFMLYEYNHQQIKIIIYSFSKQKFNNNECQNISTIHCPSILMMYNIRLFWIEKDRQLTLGKSWYQCRKHFEASAGDNEQFLLLPQCLNPFSIILLIDFPSICLDAFKVVCYMPKVVCYMPKVVCYML